MNADERVETVLNQRTRTESSGGNSDSDLSDGWNVIDHQDIPSSDGESVEVIGTDEESHENGRNMVVELPCPSERDPSSLPVTVDVIPTEERQAVLREEMFDSSFCWFLFFAAGTVLVSNLTFMAAENFFAWDVGFPTDSPSFLRDLPTTPKQIQQVESPYRISWADNEEADVETVDDSKTDVGAYEKREHFNKLEHKLTDHKISKRFNLKEKSTLLSIDNDNILEYLKKLSDMAGTPEAKEKLNQALLILDSLLIGLNDLEDGVIEHEELHETLINQKDKITIVINEIHSGVLRSMEKMANNILNKCNKLEKKFEKQWCKLERKGYKEEFKGLFHDCQDISGRRNKKGKNDKNRNQEKRILKGQMAIDGYRFEVDKDSTGKAYNIPKSNGGEISDYYNLVSNEIIGNNNKHGGAENYNEKRMDLVEGTRKKKDKLYSQDDMKLDDINIKREAKGEFKRFHKNEQLCEIKSEHNDKIVEGNYVNNYKEEDFNDYKDCNNDAHSKNDKVKVTKGEEFKNKNENDEKHNDHSNRHKDKSEMKIDEKHNEHSKRNKDKSEMKIDEKHNAHSKRHKDKSELKIDDQKRKKYENTKGLESKNERKKRFDNSNENHYKNHHYNNAKEHVPREEKLNEKKSKNIYKSDMPNGAEQNYKYYEPAIAMVSKYLRETCGKKSYEDVKLSNALSDYYRVKDSIDKHIRIPKMVFDNLYKKYCKTNSDNAHRDDKFNRNYHKGHYVKESNKKDNLPNNAVVIENPDSFLKTIMDITVVEAPEEDDEDVGSSNEGNAKVISTHRKGPQKWVFSYEETSPNNKTDVKGDWFIKAGESRSNARWSHSRGDWWFDRASHRRRYPSPPSWLSDRHKNWQFLRAWARHRCRQRPQDGWCSFPHKEHFSSDNSNFR